jgi:hypothetical protein
LDRLDLCVGLHFAAEGGVLMWTAFWLGWTCGGALAVGVCFARDGRWW